MCFSFFNTKFDKKFRLRSFVISSSIVRVMKTKTITQPQCLRRGMIGNRHIFIPRQPMSRPLHNSRWVQSVLRWTGGDKPRTAIELRAQIDVRRLSGASRRARPETSALSNHLSHYRQSTKLLVTWFLQRLRSTTKSFNKCHNLRTEPD